MRKRSVLAVSVATAFLTATAGLTAPLASAEPAQETAYLVLFKGTAADAAARAAIARAQGSVTETNAKVGYAYVTTRNARFAADLAASGTVEGVAKERVIGKAPKSVRARSSEIEKLAGERGQGRSISDAPASTSTAAVKPEPLANLQWDMRQIGATATGSYAENQGSKQVRVGIIDTGVDGTHPDLAPNFDAGRSRNFVTDLPDIDGPCEYPSCVDPANEDDNDHGTHVASTIGSPINGIGIAGVAPNVTLVNIRAGQDSGYFFLQPTLDALTYAGDIGVDVVNMSFYTDPWLFNCVDNPADTPEQQSEQRTVRRATQRAVAYATNRGVLPVAAMGNEATDLNHPTADDSSPDYPPDTAHPRTIDNSCITVPTETSGVVSISATGPSLRKAYYSNYGTEQTDLAAPGGDAYDTPDNRRNPQSLVLAAYPEKLARSSGVLNPDGTPNTPFVVRDCQGATCAYYQYLQGTSMASPHAAGVAALVVSRHGTADSRAGGLTLAVNRTESLLYRTAVPQPCPQPRTYHYTRILVSGAVAESDATCAGPTRKNGFYGHGIVNAYRAATS